MGHIVAFLSKDCHPGLHGVCIAILFSVFVSHRFNIKIRYFGIDNVAHSYVFCFLFLVLVEFQGKVSKYRVSTHPGILDKFLNFILKVPGLEMYLNFVKNPGIFGKTLEKSAVS